MKKLVLFFVAVVAVSFASCGGAANQAASPSESSVEVIETIVVDSLVADSAIVDSAIVEIAE